MDRINFFRFYSQYSLYFVALISLVFFAVSYFSYRRLGGVIGRTKIIFLAAVRALIFVLLLMFILNPTIGFVHKTTEKPTVAVIIDTSRSMTLPSEKGDQTRLETAQDFLIKNAEGPKDKKDEFRLKFFSFGSQTKNIIPEQFEDLTAEGPESRIDYALKIAGQSIRDLNPAGIILLSDGRANNAEDDSIQAAATLPCQLHTITIGSDRPEQDTVRNASIKDVECPQYAQKNKTLIIKAVIENSGYTRQTVNVELKEDGKTVKTKSTMLTSQERETVLSFDYTPTKTGRRKMEVKLSGLDNEKTASDNRRSFSLLVTGSENSVLLVCGKMNWDFSFMSRVIASDKAIDLDTFLRIRKDTWLLNGAAIRSQRIFDDKKVLFSYSAIILLNLEAEYFSPHQLSNISDFVSEKGGGLLIGGTGKGIYGANGYSGGKLASALPTSKSSGAMHTAKPNDRIVPTKEGLRHVIFQIAGMDTNEMKKAWARLIVPESFFPLTNVRDSAQKLMEVKRVGKNFTIMAGQQYGLGRTLVFTASGTWKWALKPANKGMRKMHEKFWLQIMHWILQTGSTDLDRIKSDNFIITDKQSYIAGENIRVKLKSSLLEDKDEAIASVKTPDGREENLVLRKKNAKGEIFEGSFTAQNDGVFHIKVPDLEDKGKASETMLSIEVFPDTSELKNIYADSALMKQLATIAKGQAFNQDSPTEDIWDAVKTEPKEKTEIKEENLTSNWYFFILVLLLLTIEWIYRKTNGLG